MFLANMTQTTPLLRPEGLIPASAQALPPKTVANTSLDKARPVELAFDSLRPGSVKAEILRSGKVSDYNDFDDPDKVKPEAFTAIKTKGGKVCFTLPAASIVVLEIK